MKIQLSAALLLFTLSNCYAQSDRKLSMYIYGDYSKTLKDYTKRNNPWAIGMGLQLFMNNSTSFRPTLDVAGYAYLQDDKVLRFDENGVSAKRVSDVVSLFGGVAFQPVKPLFISLTGGPGIVNGDVLFGLKPSTGIYISKSQRWVGKISYLHIYSRNKAEKESLSSLNIGVGLRLF